MKDGSEFSENKTNEGVMKISDEKKVVEKEQKNELFAKEKEVEKQKLPASNKGKFVLDHLPIEHLPYPNTPSKKDKEKQYSHFLDIFNKLQINIPFSETIRFSCNTFV